MSQQYGSGPGPAPASSSSPYPPPNLPAANVACPQCRAPLYVPPHLPSAKCPTCHASFSMPNSGAQSSALGPQGSSTIIYNAPQASPGVVVVGGGPRYYGSGYGYGGYGGGAGLATGLLLGAGLGMAMSRPMHRHRPGFGYGGFGGGFGRRGFGRRC